MPLESLDLQTHAGHLPLDLEQIAQTPRAIEDFVQPQLLHLQIAQPRLLIDVLLGYVVRRCG